MAAALIQGDDGVEHSETDPEEEAAEETAEETSEDDDSDEDEDDDDSDDDSDEDETEEETPESEIQHSESGGRRTMSVKAKNFKNNG